MRSLSTKLVVAFLLVALTGTVIVAGVIFVRTQREFNRLVLDQNQQVMVERLTAYYQAHNSWTGVESIFERPAPPQAPDFPPDGGWDNRRMLFTLADNGGVVVFGGVREGPGSALTASELKQGLPLRVDGETVGWLLFNPRLDRWRPGTPEGNFFLAINQSILWSALAAVAIALVLGGILAFTLTRSLRELKAATEALAEGELGLQVEVRSNDELGELATSFNKMSAELARLNQLRRKMTADIAHDLRTPLSVILGYSEALSDGKLQPTEEMFSVLHTEAQHLSYLVDDLRTLSLAESGDLPLNVQQVAPDVLLRRAAAAHRVRADQNQINLQVKVTENLPKICVDVDRMMQVLGNLVTNALRYTPAGGQILLSAGSQGKEVWLSVSDNGPGISMEDLPFIFERSFRGDKARHHSKGETGLGLSIAKSLVEMHGGRLTVASSPGQGAQFTAYFPRAEASGT